MLLQIHLVDASFVWTEPHSKRIKVKLTVQKEVILLPDCMNMTVWVMLFHKLLDMLWCWEVQYRCFHN